MEASQIKPDRRYMNAFGTIYHVSEIVGDMAVYRIEGIRMKDLRMQIDAFALHLVRQVEDDTPSSHE